MLGYQPRVNEDNVPIKWSLEVSGHKLMFVGEGRSTLVSDTSNIIDLSVVGIGRLTEEVLRSQKEHDGIGETLLEMAKRQWPQVNDKTRIIKCRTSRLLCPYPRSFMEDYDNTNPDEPVFAQERLVLEDTGRSTLLQPLHDMGYAAVGYGPITDTLAVRES